MSVTLLYYNCKYFCEKSVDFGKTFFFCDNWKFEKFLLSWFMAASMTSCLIITAQFAIKKRLPILYFMQRNLSRHLIKVITITKFDPNFLAVTCSIQCSHHLDFQERILLGLSKGLSSLQFQSSCLWPWVGFRLVFRVKHLTLSI